VGGAAGGFLPAKKATGDPGFDDKLASAGAIVTGADVTIDGNIITGRGPGAAMVFSLQVTEYLAGKEIADTYAKKWRVGR
jgi:4-methyl-5(b-hydroxyethyl)-thiazole monophosphate biosynthesis